MAITTNPMKAALAAGQGQIGTWINLVRNPAVLTLLKAAGLDYARIDMEHSSPSIETVADMAVLARALAFRHLDAIVGTPGVDAVTLGPSDLAQELGVFGTPEQGRVLDEHRERLLAAAARHGKDVAMLVQTLEEAERWIAAGAEIIAYASDAAVLRSGYAAAVRRLRPQISD